MRVFVFGNEDLKMDALPLELVPLLKERFPEHDFLVQDPNEDWDVSEPFYIIDTVVGLKEPQVFDSIDVFQNVPRVSMHDFDALTNLRFLKKLGKLPEVKIIGLPPMIPIPNALEAVGSQLISV